MGAAKGCYLGSADHVSGGAVTHPLFFAVADVHIANHRRFGGRYVGGLNARFHAVSGTLQDALSRVLMSAPVEGTPPLYILGDLFDTARPTVAEVGATMRVLSLYPEVHKYVLLGNHDLYSEESDDHALITLPFVDSVTIIPVMRTLVFDEYGAAVLPFVSRPPSMWLEEAMHAARGDLDVRGAPTETRVLFVHLGISDGSTPAYLRGATDSIDVHELVRLMGRFGFTHCYAGNWHNYKRWDLHGCTVVQCGALAPTGFDNPGLLPYGGLLEHRSDGKIIRHVVAGPRFVKIVYEDTDFDEWADMLTPDDRVYVSITARPKYIAEARQRLATLIERGVVRDGEVLPDRESVTAAARAASRAAITANTIDEAVARYVERVSLPEGADRQAVLAIVKRYLAR